MASDTTKRGLERLICIALTGHPCDPLTAGTVAEPSAGYGGVGWEDRRNNLPMSDVGGASVWTQVGP